MQTAVKFIPILDCFDEPVSSSVCRAQAITILEFADLAVVVVPRAGVLVPAEVPRLIDLDH